MTGLFHISTRTSSAIRPSDALLEKNNGLLLLSNVTFFENNIPRQIDAVMLPFDAISLIELASGWMAREEAGEHSAATPAPKPAPPSPVLPHGASTAPKPPTSRWLVGGGQNPK